MKSVLYWIGATILVITLLLGGFFTAAFIWDKGWPFQYVWGAGLTGLGLVLLALTRFAPAVVWGDGRQASKPGTAMPVELARIPSLLGVAIGAGGVGYALTGRVEVTISLFAAAVIYARVAIWHARRAPDSQEPPGPAA